MAAPEAPFVLGGVDVMPYFGPASAKKIQEEVSRASDDVAPVPL